MPKADKNERGFSRWGSAPEMNESSDYFLRTPRLGFRCWSQSDLPFAIALWGDPAVTQFIGGPFSEDAIKERLSRELAHMSAHKVQYWPVFLLATGDFAGCAGLRPYKPDKQICEMGVHLLQAYWGQGLAEEACRAVIHFAFGSLGARSLFAGHNPANAVSRLLLAKLGFHFTHDELYPPTGLMHPSYLLERPAK